MQIINIMLIIQGIHQLDHLNSRLYLNEEQRHLKIKPIVILYNGKI